MKQLMTVEEVATYLQQNPETVRVKIRNGELPAFRLGTGPKAPYRVDQLDIERFLVAFADGPT